MTLKICACLGKCSNSGLFPGTGADERDLAVCAGSVGRRAALSRFFDGRGWVFKSAQHLFGC